MTEFSFSSISLLAVLGWGAFGVVLVSALVLYGRPAQFAGPITEAERARVRGSRFSAARWLAIPLSAIGGVWLLMPPLFSGSFEYWSLTGHASLEAPGQFRCVVENVLREGRKQEEVAYHAGDSPERGRRRRERLAQAIVEIADEGLDIPCEGEQTREGYTSADVESVEITLLLLHARAGRLGSVVVHPGPLYSELDAWSIASEAIEPWADLEIERGESTSTEGIYKIDRAVADQDDPARLTVWAIGTREAICGSPPAPYVTGRLDTDCLVIEPIACKSMPSTQPELATLVSITCGGLDGARGAEATLHWGGARAPIQRLASGGVIVKPESKAALWNEAHALGGSRSAFDDELRSSGLVLPRLGSGPVVLDLTGPFVLIHRGDRKRCSDEPGLGDGQVGAFSWRGIGGAEPIVRVHEGCVVVVVDPDVLDPASRLYEPASFYATLRSVAWAEGCVEHGCGGSSAFEARTGELALPLLSQAEMDQALGESVRFRESLGVLLVAVSLLLAAVSQLRAARR